MKRPTKALPLPPLLLATIVTNPAPLETAQNPHPHTGHHPFPISHLATAPAETYIGRPITHILIFTLISVPATPILHAIKAQHAPVRWKTRYLRCRRRTGAPWCISSPDGLLGSLVSWAVDGWMECQLSRGYVHFRAYTSCSELNLSHKTCFGSNRSFYS